MAITGGKERDKFRNALRISDTIVISGLSGAITRSICQPLDVLKIRYQIKMNSNTSLLYSTRHILEKEGLIAFWKGHNAAQYLSIVYGIGQFGGFELLSKLTNQSSHSSHFVVGSLSGVIASIFSFPYDVIRTRLVAQKTGGPNIIYKNTLDASKKMLKNEGLKSFFRGLFPTLIAVVPYSGCQFGFYSIFTELLDSVVIKSIKMEGQDDAIPYITIGGSALCGVLSGLCSKLVVYPLDTVKKRMQIQGFLYNNSNYAGLIKSTLIIYKNDGLVGFYRGISPGMIKAMATTGINFCFYEYLSSLVGLYRLRSQQANS